LPLLLLMVPLVLDPLSAQGAPVPVRFAEGMVRGFLELSDSDGRRIASGDFLQLPRADELKCRTVLYFKDGSLHDESAVFTQERTFLMKSYRLIQKGKAFQQDMDISLDRSGGGKYRVAVGKGGREKVLEGTLDLPLDVYNGMVPTVLKNLPKGAREKIHLVAFTPAPRVIELDMVPDGEERLFIGDLEKSADHYVLKPRLGLLRLPAALLGRTPPDNHIWTITKEVPAFVRFMGPLALGGPVWRIELASPRWPK
jgi:hypothetical protein